MRAAIWKDKRVLSRCRVNSKSKETYHWSLIVDDIPKCWRAGCILRGGLLDRWVDGIESDSGSSFLELPFFGNG